jgi:acetyltransferase-like isoleucine patch superfamily enzyme
VSSSEIEVIGKGEVRVGQRTSLAPGIQAIFHRPARLTIGDYCTIGAGVKFVCDGGDVTLADWTTLHDGCLVLSGVGVSVGQHAWFGQHSVLDGTGGLTIGNGVRVGMYSQIWSHVAAGEQIEGCTLFGKRPVQIEDDVWLVGSCIVASGITIGHRSIALIGSNITKSCPPHSVLAGSPAARKEGLSFYRPIGADEQWQMLLGWLSEMSEAMSLQCEDEADAQVLKQAQADRVDMIVFAKTSEAADRWAGNCPEATVCCLQTKRYRKRLTALEHRVLKSLAGNKARFIADPAEHGLISAHEGRE